MVSFPRLRNPIKIAPLLSILTNPNNQQINKSPIPIICNSYSKMQSPNQSKITALTKKPQFLNANLSNITPLSKTLNQNPILSARYLSSATKDSPQGPPIEPHEFRHQEIVGPTVERDESALANETRQVLDGLKRSILQLSSAFAVLGVANLGVGAWIVYSMRPPDEVAVQGLVAFAFPFSMAFLMRKTLKPIMFFRKMEEQGRLQVLTLALQVSKSVNQLFLRARVMTVCCAVGVSAGSLVVILVR